MKKYIRHQMPKSSKENCPICGHENNYRFGNTCIHVNRVTDKGLIFYIKEKKEIQR